MKTKPILTHQDCQIIAAACATEARANDWAVSFAIVDDGGHLLWFERLDNAAPSSAEIGPAKARMAALGRRETKVYEEMINGGRTAPSIIAPRIAVALAAERKAVRPPLIISS